MIVIVLIVIKAIVIILSIIILIAIKPSLIVQNVVILMVVMLSGQFLGAFFQKLSVRHFWVKALNSQLAQPAKK